MIEKEVDWLTMSSSQAVKDVSVLPPIRPAGVVHLSDDTSVVIRPIQPDDALLLEAFHRRLSSESRYLRFLADRPVLPHAEAVAYATLDYDMDMAFVAIDIIEGQPQVVGVARYMALPNHEPGVAEAAIVVEDHYQGIGVGSILAKYLVDYAREHSVHTFLATILSTNLNILRFIQRANIPVKTHYNGSVIDVEMQLLPQAEPVSN